MPNPIVDLVKVNAREPGAPWFVTLAGDGLPRVDLGPYASQVIAEQDATRLREFLAALVDVLPSSRPSILRRGLSDYADQRQNIARFPSA